MAQHSLHDLGRNTLFEKHDWKRMPAIVQTEMRQDSSFRHVPIKLVEIPRGLRAVPLGQRYTCWQEMLAEHRQIIVQVQKIAEEKGRVGPEAEAPVKLWWKRHGRNVV